MKTFVRFVFVGAILIARCAWAAESSPVAFAKSVVSERGSQTFATVSYPDKTLIVEFRLEPYSTGKATAVRAFGEITKKIAQGAFSKFPKIKSVQVIGNFALRDKRGNDTVDRAVMVKFSKVNAANINWENVDPAKSSRSPISTGSCPSWAPTKNNPQVSTPIRAAAMGAVRHI
jgi:hypothetical protein